MKRPLLGGAFIREGVNKRRRLFNILLLKGAFIRGFTVCFYSIVFNIHDGVPTYEVGVYQIIPPDWKYSLNVTIIQGIPSEKCRLVEFFDGSYKMLQVAYLNGEIRVKTENSQFYDHPIVYNQKYSVEVQNRYQGVNSGSKNEWKLTVHIDGVEVSEETIIENLMLLRNIKYHIAVSDVCTAIIENPEFTIYEEGRNYKKINYSFQ